ncbi:hypothetical protein ACFPRL_15860 [Pseudoclavibacter helvolus]
MGLRPPRRRRGLGGRRGFGGATPYLPVAGLKQSQDGLTALSPDRLGQSPTPSCLLPVALSVPRRILRACA